MSLEASLSSLTLHSVCQCWLARCSAFCTTAQRWQERRRLATICFARSCCKGEEREKAQHCIPVTVMAQKVFEEIPFFCFSFSGVSGRLKQMVLFLLLSHLALHPYHSQSKRTESSPTRLMCSSHHQALCLAPTLTYLASAFHLASCVGWEKCLEGLDRSSARASSKTLRL